MSLSRLILMSTLMKLIRERCLKVEEVVKVSVEARPAIRATSGYIFVPTQVSKIQTYKILSLLALSMKSKRAYLRNISFWL